jgi:regulator of sirC expression with transglutaminase-like and TPR domain
MGTRGSGRGARLVATDPLMALDALLARGDDEIELGRAALLLASLEYPGLDLDHYLGLFDGLARQVALALTGLDDPSLIVGALAAVLHGEQGFTGNIDDYYDPRNSYLNDVLERRAGIPISLSAIYLEVGQRLGLPLEGVGMPGHFLVRYRDPAASVLFDPFAGGVIVSEAQCAARVAQLYGSSVRLTPSMLAPVGTRPILYRMLTNLKQIYVGREDWTRAVRTVDALLIVDPGATREYRDRGMLRFRSGDLRRARIDFDHYLTMAADVDDASSIRERIGLIDRLETMRN